MGPHVSVNFSSDKKLPVHGNIPVNQRVDLSRTRSRRRSPDPHDSPRRPDPEAGDPAPERQ